MTGLVFDGVRYSQASIRPGVLAEQPVVGRAVVVSAPVYDGQVYRTSAVSVAAPALGGYGVTALVFDGSVYCSAPVQIGDR